MDFFPSMNMVLKVLFGELEGKKTTRKTEA
jgi:hypothetical protein